MGAARRRRARLVLTRELRGVRRPARTAYFTVVRLVAVGLGVLLAGCMGSGSSGTGSSGPDASTVTQTVTVVTTTTVTPPASAPCAPSDFLGVLKAQFDGTAKKLTIVKAKVTRCRRDYAFVTAEPDRSVCQPGVAYCYDAVQVLLRWDGAAWRILDTGSDIGCTSIPLQDQTLQACRALGYPILLSQTFVMPSRNIGCRLEGTTVRCDIGSGLQPPPGKPCTGDWTSIVIPASGAARASCVSDTILDPAAPRLAYGATWGGGGITCLSEPSGLECANRDGHAFMLSRDSWSAA